MGFRCFFLGAALWCALVGNVASHPPLGLRWTWLQHLGIYIIHACAGQRGHMDMLAFMWVVGVFSHSFLWPVKRPTCGTPWCWQTLRSLYAGLKIHCIGVYEIPGQDVIGGEDGVNGPAV